MNPDGRGFAGWAVCMVQGPLQQNKLTAAGRARTSVAPSTVGRTDLAKRSGGYPHYLSAWVCLRQQTRIAQGATHRPSQGDRCKMQVNSNGTEGTDEQTGGLESDQAERSGRDGLQAGKIKPSAQEGQEALYCVLCVPRSMQYSRHYCTSVMVCQATCPRFV